MKIENNMPAWLYQREPEAIFKGGRKTSFSENTLRKVLSFAQDTLFNETVSRKKGLLQNTWPGLKVFTILFLIILLSLEKNLPGMSVFIVFCVAMALFSRISPGIYLKRVLPAFLFVLVIALPASLNLFVRGEPLFALFSFSRPEILGIHLPEKIFISRQGALSALTLIIRVTGSVMLVFLLTFTTTPSKLIKGLGLFMPGFLRTLLSVSYRYMFFLVQRLEEFLLIIRARIPRGGPMLSQVNDRKLAGSRAANLLILSLRLKDDLRMAMDARGMQYSFKESREKLRLGPGDILFLLLVAITAYGAYVL